MSLNTVQLIEKQSALNRDGIALVYKGEQISYLVLNEKANQMAHFLIANGATTEVVIGVAVDRSVEMVITLLGIMKSGAAYVPLDPDYPQKRLEYMLEDSQAKILITNKKYSARITSAATEICVEDIWALLDSYPASLPSVTISDESLAYILYTSGSTGMPKGVMIEHRNLLNLLISMQEFPGINEQDKLFSLTTISFDISGLELYLPLTVGAVLIIDDTEVSKDGGAILDIVERLGVTFIQATPSTYKMMLAAGWQKKYPMKVLCCGEQLPKDLAEKIIPRCAGLYNMYGPTETTIYSSGKQILATDPAITIGRPIRQTTVCILDAHQNYVEDGVIGEIAIGGSGLARGYFGKEELTLEKFIPDPQASPIGARLYRTGDLGKILPNGEILCLGRIDHQVKIRGYRIELGEIEYALLQEENIKEALVAPWIGPTGDQRLVAYIVVNNDIDGNSTSDAFKQWKEGLKSFVPAYMVPNDFVLLNKMPLTENGKVDRKALPEPELRVHGITDESDRPQTPLEIKLAEIWESYLGLTNIGIRDNFFELGGHSLIAVKIMVKLKQETGRQLPLGTLFKNPTIAQLSTLLIEEAVVVSTESLVPLQPVGNKMPLYIMHGIGSTVFKFFDFAQELDAQQPVYGLQARGIDGLEEPAQTIEEMSKQYVEEILRHNPNGPYALSGYSLGGLIAFEMNRQLEAMGKKVAVLAMFDSYIITNNQMEPGFYKELHKKLTRIAKFFYTFSLLLAEPKRTIDHKIATLKQSFRKVKGGDLRPVNGLDEDFDYITKVGNVHRQAILKYKIKPVSKEIHLFRARKLATYLNDFKFLGWKRYVKNVIVHEIDGEHDTIFNTPLNRKFAKELQEVLDQARK